MERESDTCVMHEFFSASNRKRNRLLPVRPRLSPSVVRDRPARAASVWSPTVPLGPRSRICNAIEGFWPEAVCKLTQISTTLSYVLLLLVWAIVRIVHS